MRVARCHPLLGWLRLDGHTYSRTLDQSLRERDRALELDRNHSGHAEGFVDWVWTTQLPELVRKESYDRISIHFVPSFQQAIGDHSYEFMEIPTASFAYLTPIYCQGPMLV